MSLSSGVRRGTPLEGRARASIATAAGVAAIAVYFVFLGMHASRAAGGSDSSGYLNEARALAAGRATEPIPMMARLGLDLRFEPAFRPLGFVAGSHPGTMAYLYPPGLPLHMAAAAALAGWDRGPFWVAPAAAAASLVLIFLLALDIGLPAAAGASAAAILAAHPAFLFEALQPMSDVPATAWCLAIVLFARRSRRHSNWAAAAGAAFGIAFLVRPANILVLPATLALLGFDRRRFALFVLGGFAPFLFFVAYDRAAFGHPFLTGYGRGDLSEALAWGHFPARVRHYAHWLSATLTGLVLLGWLAAPFDRWIERRDRIALFLWFAAFFLFYDFYAPYETWWYLRFLLPAFPALIVAFAATGTHALAFLRMRSVSPAMSRVTGAFAIAIVLLLEIRQIRRLRVRAIVADEETYPQAARWAGSRVPPGSLVVAMQASGALRYYTPLPTAKWDALPDTLWPLLAEAADRRGVTLYALLFPFEENEAMKRIPGAWRRLDSRRGVALWTRASPGIPGR